MKRIQLYKEAFVASLLVIVVDMLLSFIPWKFELIRPIKQGFNDFNVYDLRYSGGDSIVSKKDTDITLLEIGNTRREIAEEIGRVSALQPKIIGVDAIFFAPGEAASDSELIGTFRHTPNLVLASKYTVDSGKEWIQKSFFQSTTPGVTDGFYNFVEGPEEVTRHFTPFLDVNGSDYPAFTTRMLEGLSPPDYQRLVRRNNRPETINYAGNLAHYNVVSLDHLLHPVKGEDLDGYFRQKIVLIGFFRDLQPDVLEDLHFTPMNVQRGGKSFPDMYGVVIHANILEMMLSHRYINEMHAWLVYLSTFVIIFFINTFYIRKISRSRHHNHLLLFLLQFILAIGLLYLALLTFDLFNFASDPMPMLIAVVLSFEIFWLYEWLAVKMNKLFHYETFLHE
jgi:CHASE2 domain-containing sensor protein